jgi:DNA-binding response OmpR family regulator
VVVEHDRRKPFVPRDPDDSALRRIVLVVDDDDEIRRMLGAALGQEPDLYAIRAASGEAALRVAREVTVDAVVLDLGMPGVDGFAVARQLRRDPATRDAPIVALSALPAAAAAPSALDAGCDAFVAKPFVIQELVATIRRLLVERSRPTLSPNGG